jgi:hypothetical protein
VACKVFGTGTLSKEECDKDTSITTVEVDHIGTYHDLFLSTALIQV